MRRFAIALALAGSALAVSAPAAPALDLGFFDWRLSQAPLAGQTVEDAAGVHADTLRADVFWSAVAPGTRPAGFDADDPGDPAYRWSSVDALVRQAASRNIRLTLTIRLAPKWAQAPNRPADAPGGTWRPDPSAFGAFARAAARRYSGSYPDPQSPGATLPRVRFWQAWNEPNLTTYLSPQWRTRRGRYRAASPGHYRRLANALYRSIKAVHSDNVAVLGGLAPYGDPEPGGRRIMPVRFLRSLLCLNERLRRTCSKRTYFDILDHHPYGIRGPESHSLNPDDASVPDIRKLQRVVRAGVKAGTVRPRRAKDTWVTEISWDSSPPDPDGVPERRHAEWLQRSLYVLWRQDVDTVLWFQVRDQLPNPSYAATYQSGVLFADGRPKLAATAFQFPFVVRNARRGRDHIWGRSPADGRVAVQIKRGSSWRTVTSFPARAGSVFSEKRRLRSGRYRAVVGEETSLSRRVR